MQGGHQQTQARLGGDDERRMVQLPHHLTPVDVRGLGTHAGRQGHSRDVRGTAGALGAQHGHQQTQARLGGDDERRVVQLPHHLTPVDVRGLGTHAGRQGHSRDVRGTAGALGAQHGHQQTQAWLGGDDERRVVQLPHHLTPVDVRGLGTHAGRQGHSRDVRGTAGALGAQHGHQQTQARLGGDDERRVVQLPHHLTPVDVRGLGTHAGRQGHSRGIRGTAGALGAQQGH